MEIISGKNIQLRLAKTEDAQFIIDIRLSKGEHLSTTSPNIQDQITWLEGYKIREKEGKEYYFVIVNKSTKQDVGLIRIYDINKDTRTFTFGSFIINKEISYRLTALESITKILDFSFNKLLLNECFFDCRKNNEHANNFYRRYGAKQIKENDIDFFYYYNKESFNKNHKIYLEPIENDKN